MELLDLPLLAAQSAVFTAPDFPSLVQFGRVKRESWHRLACRRREEEGEVERSGERSRELETVVRRGVRSVHTIIVIALLISHFTSQHSRALLYSADLCKKIAPIILIRSPFHFYFTLSHL